MKKGKFFLALLTCLLFSSVAVAQDVNENADNKDKKKKEKIYKLSSLLPCNHLFEHEVNHD